MNRHTYAKVQSSKVGLKLFNVMKVKVYIYEKEKEKRSNRKCEWVITIRSRRNAYYYKTLISITCAFAYASSLSYNTEWPIEIHKQTQTIRVYYSEKPEFALRLTYQSITLNLKMISCYTRVTLMPTQQNCRVSRLFFYFRFRTDILREFHENLFIFFFLSLCPWSCIENDDFRKKSEIEHKFVT